MEAENWRRRSFESFIEQFSHQERYVLFTFEDDISNYSKVARSAQPGEPQIFQAAVAAMFEASADDHGTVQALARQLDSAHEDG
jgi:hypothetical protein